MFHTLFLCWCVGCMPHSIKLCRIIQGFFFNLATLLWPSNSLLPLTGCFLGAGVPVVSVLCCLCGVCVLFVCCLCVVCVLFVCCLCAHSIQHTTQTTQHTTHTTHVEKVELLTNREFFHVLGWLAAGCWLAAGWLLVVCVLCVVSVCVLCVFCVCSVSVLCCLCVVCVLFVCCLCVVCVHTAHNTQHTTQSGP